LISNIELACGNNSSFKINVDGSPGDRLDEYYKNNSRQLAGIIFSESSHNNFLNYADFKNAKDAITVNGLSNTSPKLNLNACVINNASGFRILSNRSSINAVNCLIYNCGSN
jgi:hypothetical protein